MPATNQVRIARLARYLCGLRIVQHLCQANHIAFIDAAQPAAPSALRQRLRALGLLPPEPEHEVRPPAGARAMRNLRSFLRRQTA